MICFIDLIETIDFNDISFIIRNYTCITNSKTNIQKKGEFLIQAGTKTHKFLSMSIWSIFYYVDFNSKWSNSIRKAIQ